MTLAASMCEIRAVAGKGLGVFANRPISRGTAILADKPLIQLRSDQCDYDLYMAFQSLPPARRADFLSLSGHAPPLTLVNRWSLGAWYSLRNLAGKRPFSLPNLDTALRIAEQVRVLSIYRTNVFQCDASAFATAVFHRACRFNHSCVPNSLGIWNEALEVFSVRATQDIDIDEEITISYLHDEGDVRRTRQARLWGYGFECQCPVCDLKSVRGKACEERRLEMRAKLGRWAAVREELDDAGEEAALKAQLAVMEGYVELFIADGVAHELSQMHLAAAKLHSDLEDYSSAMLSAEKALVIDEMALGIEHPMFLKNLELKATLRTRQQPSNCPSEMRLRSAPPATRG